MRAEPPDADTPEKLISGRQLLRVVRMQLFDLSEGGRKVVEQQTGKAPTCKKGCGYCCYQKVVMSAAEGVLIYLFLRDSWTPALEARLVAADREMTNHTHATWLAARRPCVFLKEDGYGHGACEVYTVRPYACATLYSVTPDPAACGVVGGRATLMMGNDLAQAWFGDLYSQLLATLGETQVHYTTLPGAVLEGRALVEGLPPPSIHRLDQAVALAAENPVAEIFDAIAQVRALDQPEAS